VEFLKNVQEDFENGMILYMGQILSIPFIIAGFWFIYKGLKAKKRDLIPVKNPRKSA
jgi:prolipoprotein diacylglyceryltransferase